MSVQVRIPAVMRANTAGQAVVSCEGGSVGEVLENLVAQFPDISAVLFEKDNQLHKYVNMYLESDDIRYIGGLSALVGDAKELTILPAVAGGCE